MDTLIPSFGQALCVVSELYKFGKKKKNMLNAIVMFAFVNTVRPNIVC